MKINICHLYPDVLNLYGDIGNIICMKKRLEWRGVEVSVRDVKMGQKLDWQDFDLIFIGSGREDEQLALLDDLLENKGKTLARDELMTLVWGKGYTDIKVVDVNIRRLRLKIEEDAANPQHIVTVWGSGYKWKE